METSGSSKECQLLSIAALVNHSRSFIFPTLSVLSKLSITKYAQFSVISYNHFYTLSIKVLRSNPASVRILDDWWLFH